MAKTIDITEGNQYVFEGNTRYGICEVMNNGSKNWLDISSSDKSNSKFLKNFVKNTNRKRMAPERWFNTVWSGTRKEAEMKLKEIDDWFQNYWGYDFLDYAGGLQMATL